MMLYLCRGLLVREDQLVLLDPLDPLVDLVLRGLLETLERREFL